MKPPLILMAHFDLSELSLCPDCNRVSNDTLSCNACGNRLGLLSLSQALNGRAAAEATGGVGARGERHVGGSVVRGIERRRRSGQHRHEQGEENALDPAESHRDEGWREWQQQGGSDRADLIRNVG